MAYLVGRWICWGAAAAEQLQKFAAAVLALELDYVIPDLYSCSGWTAGSRAGAQPLVLRFQTPLLLPALAATPSPPHGAEHLPASFPVPPASGTDGPVSLQQYLDEIPDGLLSSDTVAAPAPAPGAVAGAVPRVSPAKLSGNSSASSAIAPTTALQLPHPNTAILLDAASPEGRALLRLSQSRYRQAKGDLQLDVTYAGSDPPHHIPQRVVRAVWEPREYPACLPDMLGRSPDECLPQLYTDPRVFRSTHPDLSDLQLPPWAHSPEHFVALHRALLESDHVSSQLHHWIDLMFGYKLTGAAAVAAKNERMRDDCGVTSERLLGDVFFGPELHAAHTLLRTTLYRVAPGSLTMLAGLCLRAFVRLARSENLAWVVRQEIASKQQRVVALNTTHLFMKGVGCQGAAGAASDGGGGGVGDSASPWALGADGGSAADGIADGTASFLWPQLLTIGSPTLIDGLSVRGFGEGGGDRGSLSRQASVGGVLQSFPSLGGRGRSIGSIEGNGAGAVAGAAGAGGGTATGYIAHAVGSVAATAATAAGPSSAPVPATGTAGSAFLDSGAAAALAAGLAEAGGDAASASAAAAAAAATAVEAPEVSSQSSTALARVQYCGHRAPVHGVAVLRAAGRVASGGAVGASLDAAGQLHVWALDSGQQLVTFGPGFTVMCEAAEQCGTLYAGTADARVCVLDVERRRVVSEWLAAPVVRQYDPDDAITALFKQTTPSLVPCSRDSCSAAVVHCLGERPLNPHTTRMEGRSSIAMEPG
eukprot:XP_001701522.1 predicted protein [Chlamydomonas reinhardtii]